MEKVLKINVVSINTYSMNKETKLPIRFSLEFKMKKLKKTKADPDDGNAKRKRVFVILWGK